MLLEYTAIPASIVLIKSVMTADGIQFLVQQFLQQELSSSCRHHILDQYNGSLTVAAAA